MDDHDGAAPADQPGRGAAALAGTVGAAAALAAGELTSAVLDARPSPVLAVGGRFIDEFAASLKEVAIAVFGTNDKAALVTGTVLISLALGAVVGILARRHRWVAVAGIGGFAVFGALAQLADAQGVGADAWLVAMVETVIGVAAIWALLAAATPEPTGAAAAPLAAAEVGVATAERATAGPAPAPAPVARRRFLAMAGGVTASAVLAALWARSLQARDVVAEAATRFRLRAPTRTEPIPAQQPFTVDGSSPFVVPTDDFYRIDTALSVPQVDASSWRLRIEGAVDEPFELTYGELLELPSVEQAVTLQCVSNEVGGDLVGNAVWQGVPLRDLLDRAGVQAGGTQVFSRSVDGWTCGFPTEALDGDRTALVAYAMNGEPLPAEHGFPARLVVSGLYGYVSATKWLRAIELVGWDEADGYWVPRGWSKEGPIKLASRIDHPGNGKDITGTPAVLGGQAWLPGTGVEAVEVSIDEGPWERAELGSVTSTDTWVTWRFEVPLELGSHHAQVRAIDADGRTQIADEAPPAPDGATGLHRVRFDVVA